MCILLPRVLRQCACKYSGVGAIPSRQATQSNHFSPLSVFNCTRFFFVQNIKENHSEARTQLRLPVRRIRPGDASNSAIPLSTHPRYRIRCVPSQHSSSFSVLDSSSRGVLVSPSGRTDRTRGVPQVKYFGRNHRRNAKWCALGSVHQRRAVRKHTHRRPG